MTGGRHAQLRQPRRPRLVERANGIEPLCFGWNVGLSLFRIALSNPDQRSKDVSPRQLAESRSSGRVLRCRWSRRAGRPRRGSAHEVTRRISRLWVELEPPLYHAFDPFHRANRAAGGGARTRELGCLLFFALLCLPAAAASAHHLHCIPITDSSYEPLTLAEFSPKIPKLPCSNGWSTAETTSFRPSVPTAEQRRHHLRQPRLQPCQRRRDRRRRDRDPIGPRDHQRLAGRLAGDLLRRPHGGSRRGLRVAVQHRDDRGRRRNHRDEPRRQHRHRHRHHGIRVRLHGRLRVRGHHRDLAPGTTFLWFVQTYGPAGYGPWSEGREVVVLEPLDPIFDDGFELGDTNAWSWTEPPA